MSHKVVIVGSGIGGLVSAIRLAHYGYKVQVFEKNEGPGGKASVWHQDGFTFDTGPSLLTLPQVFNELFTEVKANADEIPKFLQLEEICRYFFRNGKVVHAWSDKPSFQKEIELCFPKDGSNILEYFEYCKKIYDLTADIFLFSDLLNLKHLTNPLAWKTFLNLQKIDPFRSVHEANTSFFESPELLQIFDRYATYNGSDPFQAPATLNIIPHVEYGIGGYYVSGGIFALIKALFTIASRKGVDFHFNQPVRKILHRNGKVNGVQLMDDSVIQSAIVISNTDVHFTYSRLLGTLPKRFKKAEPSCSAIVFLWGIKGLLPELSHHNLFFSEDYKKEFFEIFKENKAPSDPSIYVSITSKHSPENAPEGCTNLFVMVNMPWLTEPENREKLISEMKAKVLKKLGAYGMEINKETILVEKVLTPGDLESDTNSYKGGIYGFSSNSRMAAFLRQPNESGIYKGLYFASGSAHPGGGMPLVALAGIHASNAIMKKYA